MMKLMLMTLAILGSVSAHAGLVTGNWDAVQDQKAVGITVNLAEAVQDQKAMAIESQVETAQLLDLNQGF